MKVEKDTQTIDIREDYLLKKDKLIQNPDLKEIVIRIEQDA